MRQKEQMNRTNALYKNLLLDKDAKIKQQAGLLEANQEQFTWYKRELRKEKAKNKRRW